MAAAFIGVDLAWAGTGKNSGLAAFVGDASGADPVAVGGTRDLAEVLDFIVQHRADTTVVAIDAPLIIANETGRRPCEKEISRHFGRYHAGAHSSNRSLYPDAASVQLADTLLAEGFRHFTPSVCARPCGDFLFETFPHPAQVTLLDRKPTIIKYKKGRVGERRQGLDEFRRALAGRIVGDRRFRDCPPLSTLLGQPIEALRGSSLKDYEDGLDAVFCAFLAFHLWGFGWERNDFVGNLDQGYIVVPRAGA